LPLTTGPFIFIIYIQEGASFAARTAHGVLVGQVALIVFSWVYAISALKISWSRALATGTIACLATGAVLTSFEISLYGHLPPSSGRPTWSNRGFRKFLDGNCLHGCW
jgi:hypothetical protein